jgi:predicted phage terminase large subunit-like protein
VSLTWANLAANAWIAKDIPAADKIKKYATPGELAKVVEPTTKQTALMDLLDQTLVDIENGICDRVLISCPPQEGKSTRVTKTGPLWFLLNNPDRRIAIASYNQELANEFGRDIRNMIASNQGEDDTVDLGLRIASDNGAVAKWSLAGHKGSVKSVGIFSGLTGRPVDMLLIDDPVKSEDEANSETYRKRVLSFWQSVGLTRLAPGAPVIVIATRWHERDLIGELASGQDKDRWRVINVPAQADHDPAKGEADPLGREVGEYLTSARDTETAQRDWAGTKIGVGSRVWNALYQGRPSPAEGGIFKRDHWKSYDTPLWVEEDGVCRTTGAADELIMSWDMTFKAAKTSDYVVGQVWLKRGANVYLLDQVRRRMTFTETLAAVKAFVAKWPQCSAKLVEDKANGTAVLDVLKVEMPGLIAVNPKESKEARASAVSPFVEAGNVFLPAPKIRAWVGDFIEEMAAFPNGANDDQCDGMTQALQRLLVRGGQGAAFLTAMKNRAEATGTTVPTHARNWRQSRQPETQ